jgi:agmatine deiminase
VGRDDRAGAPDYATVANGTAAFEPVTMTANAGAVHFGFNAWGEKFAPYDKDARWAGRSPSDSTIGSSPAGWCSRGGSILSDGGGVLLTSEQCRLNANRNPRLSRHRHKVEDVLRARFGVERIVWLGHGFAEDLDPDGDVDPIASNVAPGRVLLETAPAGNPNHECCEENRLRLVAAGIEVLELPYLPHVDLAAEPVAIIAAAGPDRELVSVRSAVLAHGGGGPHCLTQRVPARR